MTAAEVAKADGYAAFRFSDFRLHFVARFLYGIAVSMQAVATGWYIYAVTDNPLALGVAGLMSFLPVVSLALFTGHIADIYDRRLILSASFATSALASLALCFLVRSGVTNILPVYACVLAMGTARAFANPCAQSLTPNLVPREHFANAITWYTSAWSAARIVGPALGGLLYILGASAPFLFAFLSTFVAAVGVFMIANPGPRRDTRSAATWATLSAGLRFIWSQKMILGGVSLDLVTVLFGGATALLPIVANDILHIGPWGLGLLRSSPAFGAIVMGAWLAHFPIRSGAGKKMFIAAGVYGLATIGFGLSAHMMLAMSLLAVVGAADQVSVVVRHTMVQSETPDDMRGRVSAVGTIFISGASDLGDFESGVTAWLMGTTPAIIFGGAATGIMAAAWSRIFPQLRNRDKLVGK